jgi:hypothetical protein
MILCHFENTQNNCFKEKAAERQYKRVNTLVKYKLYILQRD